MAKTTREDVKLLIELSALSTDDFFDRVSEQWGQLAQSAARLVVAAVVKDDESGHDGIIKDMIRLGNRCGVLRGMIEEIGRTATLRAPFEPSDTDLQQQLDRIRAANAAMRNQED